jgi:NAD(P)H-nitrite reductase large subunit
VLDERATPGGQYYKQAAPELGLPPLDAQQRAGHALWRQAEAAGVRLLAEAEVVMAIGPQALLVTQPGRAFVARCRALIVATGAYERGVPLPGWTLPGVMTTGALQTLWRSHRVLPGKRLLIAGNGPLNLQVAGEAMAAGAEVVAVVEAAAKPSPAHLFTLARLASADPRLTFAGLRMLARAGARSRPRFGAVVRRISAAAEGLMVEVGAPAGGAGEAFTVDAVALGHGFLPANELLRALGCAHDYDRAARMLRTRRAPDCETSVVGVYAIGDCCGLGGAPAACEEGVIAGTAIVARLGAKASTVLVAQAEQAQRRLARHRRFQQALWRLFAAPQPGLALADDDTLVCRCEEVPKRDIVAAAADGRASIAEVKRRTRCGMGRCQGRYCAPLVAEHLAATQGRPLDEMALFAPRGPFKPATIADLVGTGEAR